jgi:hypothetical protein
MVTESEKKNKVGSSSVRATHPASEVMVEDQVRLRKPHPCGSFDWRIVRVGADIGMRCLGCDHKVMLSRSVFERRFKSYLSHATNHVITSQPEPQLPLV